MKKYIYIITAAFVALLSSCQADEETISTGKEVELTFSPEVKDMTVVTRALGDEFFPVGGEINVNITSSNPRVGSKSYVYTYGSDRIFKGNPGFRFTLDDHYITELTAVWPTEDVRQRGVNTDQRTEADYKAADWMTTTLDDTLEGIMPTDAPVPLNFKRENVMLEFELVGQNTKGLDIQSLLIELQNPNGQATAFWAYCGNPNGHAELILDPGTSLFSSADYLIGRITVSNNDNYTIIFQQTDVEFEAGKRYLVTLTPQGYYMNAYVVIGGWNTGEEGIGIPFQQPTPIEGGAFSIGNPQQLITMSYLVRNYENGSFSWSSSTYNLSGDLGMTTEYADQYIPIPKNMFSGSIMQGGAPIDTLIYMNGADEMKLPLFTE